MKRWTENKIQIIGALLGGAIGYAYWYFWACENGCAITSVWWKTTLVGMLYGWIIMDAIKSFVDSRSKKTSVNKE